MKDQTVKKITEKLEKAGLMPLRAQAELSEKLLEKRYQGDEGKKDIHERDEAYLHVCRESAYYAARRLGWRMISCSEGNNPKTVEEIHREILGCLEESLRQRGGPEEK